MMQQMEIRSRQNRDATLSCSLGTASLYCFTNHLPALLHILTNHVSYMLTNPITLHSNILYIVCHHITLLTATLYSFSLHASLLLLCILQQLLYILPHFITIHVTCIALFLHCILHSTLLRYFMCYIQLVYIQLCCYFTHYHSVTLHTNAANASKLHYFNLQYLLL